MAKVAIEPSQVGFTLLLHTALVNIETDLGVEAVAGSEETLHLLQTSGPCEASRSP
jgi:hypothetical protein